MWNYDKLFAEGNVIGLKNVQQNRIFPSPVDGKEYWDKEGYVDWRDYYNESLSVLEGEDGGCGFEIQYIIRLDKHGNVIEKLFDRETDMPTPMPELETGMFVRVGGHKDNTLGFIDAENNHIIYQDGGYDFIDDDKKALGNGVAPLIVEVYGKDTLGFRYCGSDELIWRSPEYQDYLDSKN